MGRFSPPWIHDVAPEWWGLQVPRGYDDVCLDGAGQNIDCQGSYDIGMLNFSIHHALSYTYTVEADVHVFTLVCVGLYCRLHWVHLDTCTYMDIIYCTGLQMHTCSLFRLGWMWLIMNNDDIDNIDDHNNNSNNGNNGDADGNDDDDDDNNS